MQLLICGSRLIGQVDQDLTGKAAAQSMNRASAERKFVQEYLSRIHSETPITLLVLGEEGGVGGIGLNWARVNKVPALPWRRLKFPKSTLLNSLKSFRKKEASADYVLETIEARNARMLAGSQPELVLAFGGGETTKLLVQAAKEKGLNVIEIDMPSFS